ncbi:hypothetical protein [Streptacidiphilus rugosus]|uniref:hypothetical protein n=1 Tax=Streptacidiphilus rugosus TaxID=405783 RepID=UPI00055A0012|nr:hypothetical protein [Streptacidiphilus rugosus]
MNSLNARERVLLERLSISQLHRVHHYASTRATSDPHTLRPARLREVLHAVEHEVNRRATSASSRDSANADRPTRMHR